MTGASTSANHVTATLNGSGPRATSHISGRAGWWKSPSPDLVRASGSDPPGLPRKSIGLRDQETGISPDLLVKRADGQTEGMKSRVHPTYKTKCRVENAFFRYKSIIADSLRARTPAGQAAEALLACNVLNQMIDLGNAIGR